MFARGPLAHLVERLICNEEVTGSIPVGSTKDTNVPPARDFVLLRKAQPYFALAKWRAGVASEFSDEKIRLVTTKAVHLEHRLL
jgi:hypothetical protein